MVSAGDLFVSYWQSELCAVACEVSGLLAQQRQFGAADDQRQRVPRAASLHDRRVAARRRFIEAELDVEIAVADRLEIVDAADPHARFYLRMRQRHRRQMSAGGPSRYHDPARVTAEPRQSFD